MAIVQDALNYPYIRIRDVNWLKSTLLLFPHVARIVPERGAPIDSPEIEKFCWTASQGSALLRPAKLDGRHVLAAQRTLISQLDRHFRRKSSSLAFSPSKPAEFYTCGMRENIWQRRTGNQNNFQLHHDKMAHELVEFLFSNGLARWPSEEDAHAPGYIEVNAKIGQAIMATIAVACAENEGMQVVTEFPDVHGSIIGRPKDKILEACLKELEFKRPAAKQLVAEFLIYRRCDVQNLTAEGIAALKSEKDALSDFRMEIERVAQSLPDNIRDDATLNERLEDICNDIFRNWRRDQVNLSSYSRKIFGDGVLSEPAKLLQEIAKASFSMAGGAGAGAGLGKVFHLDIPAAAEAGFAIGFALRAVSVYGEVRKKAVQSPTRYLTMMAKHGVGFSGSAMPKELETA